MSSADLYARALQVIPGGVNSPVRAMKAVGLDAAALRGARRGRLPRGRRGPALPRLGALVGAADLRARRPGDGRGGRGRGARRHELRHGDRARGRAGRGDRRRGAVGGDGAARLVRHRGGDDHAAAGTRGDRPRAVRPLPRQLPRPRRPVPLRGRLGRAHARARGRRERGASSTTTTSRRSRRAIEGAACVFVEPVAGNMGVVPPADGFLEGLRRLCDASGALLVFDEVITGFRVARGGAQERYGVLPDLTVLGKIVGGGLPLAAFGGRGRADGAARAGRRRLPGGHALREPARDRRRACPCCGVSRPRSTSSSRRRAAGSTRSGSTAASSASARWRRCSSTTTRRSSATCSSAASTWRRARTRRCSSRPPTATRRSTARIEAVADFFA